MLRSLVTFVSMSNRESTDARRHNLRMPPACAMHDGGLSMGSFHSICTQPVKVAQPCPVAHAALSAAAVPRMHLGDWNASPRHAICAAPCLESPASSPSRYRCSIVASPPPASAAHFQAFFGACAHSLDQAGQPGDARLCGEFCGPALLETRCPYGKGSSDARLREIFELLKSF